YSNAAGHAAEIIGDDDGVIARVGKLRVAARETIGSRAAEVRAVEAPLVAQRYRTERSDGESGALADGDGLVRRLRSDVGRGRDAQRAARREIVCVPLGVRAGRGRNQPAERAAVIRGGEKFESVATRERAAEVRQ